MSEPKVDLSEQMTLKEMEEELRRRKRENPLKYVYDPHQFQERVHKSRAPITLVVGANRTGKSYCGVAEALFYALGRSEYAEVPDPPNRVWYVVPTSSVWSGTGGVKEEVFEELVPWDRVVEHNKRTRTFKFDNGSTLSVKTTDQRQKRVVGASIDLVVADEPMPQTFYQELQARVMDKSGRVVMVFTPVGDKVDQWMWIRDELYTPAETGERGDIEVIHMPMVDENGEPTVPHLSQKQVDQFARSYPDPAVRAARMYGEFVSRSGLVFSTYDPDIHLVDRFEPPPNWHEWLICDPQYHRFAVLKFAADERNGYYVTDEYFSVDEPLAKRAERIKVMVGDRERDIPMYVDYANPQDITELNYHFRRIGAPIGAMPLPMQKKVDRMILRTHSLLEPQEERTYHPMTGLENVYGAPRLCFFNDLQSSWEWNGKKMRTSRLLWELNRLSWGKRQKPDKDSAAGADCSDCLIYGCSIQASGLDPKEDADWKKGLNDLEVHVWEEMERMDQREEKGRWTFR